MREAHSSYTLFVHPIYTKDSGPNPASWYCSVTQKFLQPRKSPEGGWTEEGKTPQEAIAKAMQKIHD